MNLSFIGAVFAFFHSFFALVIICQLLTWALGIHYQRQQKLDLDNSDHLNEICMKYKAIAGC